MLAQELRMEQVTQVYVRRSDACQTGASWDGSLDRLNTSLDSAWDFQFYDIST